MDIEYKRDTSEIKTKITIETTISSLSVVCRNFTTRKISKCELAQRRVYYTPNRLSPGAEGKQTATDFSFRRSRAARILFTTGIARS